MRLITNSMTQCERLVERDASRSDGMGGTQPVWVKLETFSAAFVYGRTEVGPRGERTCARDICAVIVDRAQALQFHDVIRRIWDGALFRVISNGEEHDTPPGAGLQLRQVRVERWEMPA